MPSDARSLRRELRQAGLTARAIDAVWPEWWSEEAAQSLSATAELRYTLARRLGLSPRSLFEGEPQFVWKDEAKYKNLGTVAEHEVEVLSSFGVAVGQCAVLATASRSPMPTSAAHLRSVILETARVIGLGELLSFCWAVGVPVIQLRLFPLIASEIGRDRTTVSRWFSADLQVIEELARQVEDQREIELHQHLSLRKKAMHVVEEALDGGDVKAALAILRLGPKPGDRTTTERGSSASSLNPFEAAQGYTGQNDVDARVRDLQVTYTWQAYVERAGALLLSACPASDSDGIFNRLLLLDDVASTLVTALEEADGQGLAGYASVNGPEQQVLLGNATKAIEESWAILGGGDEDDDNLPTWPGEESADRAIRLIAECLEALMAFLEGAPEVLSAGADSIGKSRAVRLTAALEAGRLVIDGGERQTVASLANAVATLTTGFGDLVAALAEDPKAAVDRRVGGDP